MTRTVAIVGGGISGLSVAEAVERRSAAAGTPARALVLEAEAEPGGKIRSKREAGFVVDTGPHGFLDKEPLMFELIDRLGLTGALVRADEASARRFIVRGARLREVPMSPPRFLTSDILPLFGKLRVLLEPFARARPEGVDESVHQFAARRIGTKAAEILVDAMVTGIYGGDPKALSLKSAFPRMFELETEYRSLIRAQIAIAKEKKQLPARAGQPTGTLCSFTEGVGAVTRALAERHEVRTGAEVRRIEPAGAGFRLHGAGDPVDADAVVLAVPAYAAAELLGPHVPAASAAFGDVPYAPIAVIVQTFAKDAVRSLDGFGFLAPHLERRAVLGSIWASTVFPIHVPDGTIMFRTMIGGARSAKLLEHDDAELLALAKSELAVFSGLDPEAKPLLERVIRWDRGIPQYTLGHEDRVEAADAVERELPGCFVTGNGFRGVAMLTCVADADRVATRVAEQLGRAASPVA